MCVCVCVCACMCVCCLTTMLITHCHLRLNKHCHVMSRDSYLIINNIVYANLHGFSPSVDINLWR